MQVLEMKQPEWTEKMIGELSQSLATVFLEDWGGPRSPLALQYIHEMIIPDLVHCFRQNADLLQNRTFAEIVGWKLKTQFGYPGPAVDPLAEDLLRAALGNVVRTQVTEVKEPWRRIFRLWVSGESLPNIAERTGYPLDYLDLLLLRLKKMQKFMMGRGVSLLECLRNEELKEYGFEQLSFLYQFQSALSSEPLYQERLMMEQVIHELKLPLEVSDLVTVLEIIHEHEGEWSEASLGSALREMMLWQEGPAERGAAYLFPDILHGLMALYWVQKNKLGKLSLSEKSAKVLAGFVLPRVTERLREALKSGDLERIQEILLVQNPEVLVRIIEWVAEETAPEQAFKLLAGIFKQVNRRIDLCIIQALGHLENAWDFLLAATGEKDSLVRAKGCEMLGNLGRKESVPRLLACLEDDVAGVREMAAQALGKLGERSALGDLERLAGEYSETTAVREKAKEAVRRLQKLS